jgi:hypothetical protein
MFPKIEYGDLPWWTEGTCSVPDMGEWDSRIIINKIHRESPRRFLILLHELVHWTLHLMDYAHGPLAINEINELWDSIGYGQSITDSLICLWQVLPIWELRIKRRHLRNIWSERKKSLPAEKHEEPGLDPSA